MPLQIGWLDMKGLEANILVEEGGVLEEEAFVLQKLSTTNRAVPGRLKGHHLAYEALGAEPYIVGLVKHGYKLVWEDKPPPPSVTRNNKSVRLAPEWTRAELSRLEALGCIKEGTPTNILPLSRVFSNKWRLVLDCSRGLNPWCEKRGIRLDDLSHITNTIQRGDYMVVNDLDSGYWHVPVHEQDQRFLGIRHEMEDGTVKTWVWTVLVLGVRDAVHIFTRIIAPIMGELRKQSIRGQIYIDDLITADSTKEGAIEGEKKAKKLFEGCGWVFKEEKRSGEPSQEVKYLGLVINSKEMTFNIPVEKQESIIGRIREIKGRRKVKVKAVARVIGTLQSVGRATGPIVRIMTRSLYKEVSRAKTWASFVTLCAAAEEELNWWEENLKSVSKYPILSSMSGREVNSEAASDASDLGYYSYLVGPPKEFLAARAFSEEERDRSSTWRELAAIKETWTDKGRLERFRGWKLVHYTDNKATASIVSKGSRQPHLQELIRETIMAMREYEVEIECVWKSREDELIRWADGGSREFYADDIELDFDSMAFIYHHFGDFDIDCFASRLNNKGRCFFSRRDGEGAVGLDFFSQKLLPENTHFCFPPPGSLVMAKRHFERYETSAVMIVPVWASSTFFPTFFPDGKHAAEFVTKMRRLQPIFICGPLVKSNGMRGRKSYITAVLAVDFRRGVGRREKQGKEFCLDDGCNACLL